MILKISQKQLQKQILAPVMQQSIEILQLPHIDLESAIEQELQNNPLLEIDETKTKIQNQFDDLVNKNIQKISETDNTPSYYTNNDVFDDEIDEFEKITAAKAISLEDHLLEQLRLETSDPLELKIGETIINELDEDGYFKSTCEQIALSLGISDIKKVEDVLDIIQNFDPIGIASRDLKECLLTQTLYKFNGKGNNISKVIKLCLPELSRKKFMEISKKVKLPIEKIKEIAKDISTLEPKPARKYRYGEMNIYIKPDVIIVKEASSEDDKDKKYEIDINRDGLPHLRINSFYQKILKQPNRTEEEVAFIKDKIKNAIFFIKSIEQRNQTIKDIANQIVEHQKDFFEQGHQGLRPLTLKDIASLIGRNESTVCRAINGKYLSTPRGLYPMKYFFSQGLDNNKENNPVASRSIKEEIKILIDEEDKNNPLSDIEIQNKLLGRNMSVARRTITKYRKTLNILPSNLRKE